MSPISTAERKMLPRPDLAACGTVLNTQPPSPELDQARAMLAEAWARQGEATAAQAWPQSIADEPLRRKAEERIRFSN